MTTSQDFIDDLPDWYDVSNRLGYQVENPSPEAVAATQYDDPKVKAFALLQASAMRQRRAFEAANPGKKFPGVFPGQLDDDQLR